MIITQYKFPIWEKYSEVLVLNLFLCAQEIPVSCEECNKTLQTETSLNKQRITTHGETHQRQTDAVFADNSKEDTVKGFMKKSIHKKQNQVSNPSICSHSITTELNTLLNGSKEGQERKMVLAMKNS